MSITEKLSRKPTRSQYKAVTIFGVTAIVGTIWIGIATDDGPTPPPAASSGLGKAPAWQMCIDAAQAQVQHPTTFHADPWSASWHDTGEGPASLTATFKAKNSFGLELKYKLRCLFDRAELTNVSVSEAGS